MLHVTWLLRNRDGDVGCKTRDSLRLEDLDQDQGPLAQTLETSHTHDAPKTHGAHFECISRPHLRAHDCKHVEWAQHVAAVACIQEGIGDSKSFVF